MIFKIIYQINFINLNLNLNFTNKKPETYYPYSCSLFKNSKFPIILCFLNFLINYIHFFLQNLINLILRLF